MLIIRLQRTGRKHETTFRIVVTDSKNGPKSGKVLEVIGNYDPRKTDEKIDADRAKYWISKGAQLSDTIHNFFINKKIISGKKVNPLSKKSPIKKEAKEGEAKPAVAGGEAPAKAPEAEAPKTEVKSEPKAETKKEETKAEPKKEETK